MNLDLIIRYIRILLQTRGRHLAPVRVRAIHGGEPAHRRKYHLEN
jgi:hypothetical protein